MGKRIRRHLGHRFDRWLELHYRQRQAARGRVVLVVDESIGQAVRAAVYQINVERAAARWAGRETDVSLAEWRREMISKGHVIGRYYPGQSAGTDEAGASPG